MKTIPQIRQKLYELAESIGGTYEVQIKKLTRQLKRRSPVRRARKESVTMTPALARRIRNAARVNPNVSYLQLIKMYRFPVSIGRISEVLAGKRAA
jgi:hypothetical protein